MRLAKEENVMVRLLGEHKSMLPELGGLVARRVKDNLANADKCGVALSFEEFLDLYQHVFIDKKGIPITRDEFKAIVCDSQAGALSVRVTGALFLWNIYKNIYRFTPELSAEIKKSEWLGSMPMSVFDTMPEPVLFIDMPEPVFGYRYVIVKKDYKYSDRSSVMLEIILHDDNRDIEEAEGKFFLLDMSASSVDEALERIFINDRTIEFAFDKSQLSLPTDGELGVKEKRDRLIDMSREYIKEVLPYITYMCSYQADVVQVTPEKVRKKNPDMPIKHVVGSRLSVLLKKHRLEYQKAEDAPDNPAGGTSHRPHLRRGHFRNQWYGSKIKGNRWQQAIWIPPSFVNFGEDIIPDEITTKTFSR